jgi:alginate O-acetyltransferase complex protein AlgI
MERSAGKLLALKGDWLRTHYIVMLFNTYEFILLFLPISLLGYYFIRSKLGRESSLLWIAAVSIFFYGYWNPIYIVLIFFSIFVNYAFGLSLSQQPSKFRLILGIGFNLLLLGYFKYANFFVESVNGLFETQYQIEKILLPLAISFFTFQQISYLVDSYKGYTREYKLIHYFVFVTFFPQLIAGPIVHHREMMGQFEKNKADKKVWSNMSVGLFIFSLGLFKKVILADTFALYATPVFDAAAGGVTLTIFEAWTGALAYTFQLYFDFSGYSDMAIGLARMFGIRLPLNFFSPYKSGSIIEFWRRWHITLSRFLRDYLYIPLGGSRKGKFRKYINLLVTMTLGGLWHGAGWTFVIWGILHGGYLCVNHAWLYATAPFRATSLFRSRIYKLSMIGLTFIAVVISWVFFRADNLQTALNIVASMMMLNGVSLSASMNALANYDILGVLRFDGMFKNGLLVPTPLEPLLMIVVGSLVVFLLPNTYQMLRRYRAAIVYDDSLKQSEAHRLSWRPNALWSLCFAFFLGVSLMGMTRISEFLYFQF